MTEGIWNEDLNNGAGKDREETLAVAFEAFVSMDIHWSFFPKYNAFFTNL